MSAASATAGILLPTLFLSHGGGPCFFMEGGMFAEMDKHSRHAEFYRRLPSLLPAPPSAILVISAHWEGEAKVIVQSGAAPPMLFDYYGFEKEAYELKFPAPGAPGVAARVRALLATAGIPSGSDDARGFDHGVFVPLLLAYPKADVPVPQLSLRGSLDPGLHLRIGAALAPLRREGVLIFGSGAATHNLGAIRRGAGAGPAVSPQAKAFIAWLNETLTAVAPAERLRRLEAIEREAPHYRDMHPRSEHLTPLFVAVGAAAPAAAHGVDDAALAAVDAASGAAELAAAGAPAGPSGSGKGSLVHEGFVLSAFAMHGWSFS